MRYSFKGFILITILLSIISYSQNYKVAYKLTYKTDSTKDIMTSKIMLLEVTNNISKFCSYDYYKNDSIYNANIKSGKEVYKPMFDSNFFVVNDRKKLITTKFYNFPPNSNIYKVNEIKNNLGWKILKETKKINDYLCQKAVLKYKGREWTAWFTTEIPLNIGPYIFDGLPGAILYLEDSKQNYIFEFHSLNKNSITNINTHFSAFKVSKEEYIKINLDYYNDPYKEMRNDETLIENSVGELIKPNINQITKEKQEFIKRNNNPIELSDAIKYP